jgi:hypothetical protein
MKPTLIAMVAVAATLVSASADEGLQKARVVSIKKYSQGRIVFWEGRTPIFDGNPLYDITLDWQGKKYAVRYESLTGYFPRAWESGKEILVKRERGRFILYRGDEAVPAREVSPNDCVPANSPVSGSTTQQIPCE